jgi:glyoxylase-like metal-dependent hydrolase (beta-lactamase superfamily II)
VAAHDHHRTTTREPHSLNIQTFVAAGFEVNAYIAWSDRTNDAVAIDPGGESVAMADFIEQNNLRLSAILLTHAHLDHIEGVAKLVRRWPAPIYLHDDDRKLYAAVALQAVQFGMVVDPLPPVDQALTHGQQLHFGPLNFEVRHVPGHAPGHVILYARQAGLAFVGDVVFQGSIGRTDLPGGNYQELMRSIRQQVLTLPPATRLYCGHGPATTVQHEATTNPFLVPSYGGGGFA